MFRIRQIHDTVSPGDQMALGSVIEIYQKAFADDAEYAAEIARLIDEPRGDLEVVLLVAEGAKDRILGFALTLYLRDIKFGYLDYIVADPKRSNRGYGAALYEATREALLERGAHGMFLDVLPDDRAKLKNPRQLPTNERRLAFYERLGARPIVNTLYDVQATPAYYGELWFLVFDDLGLDRPLRRTEFKRFLRRFLALKHRLEPDDPKFKAIVDSVRDDPVKLRPPRYTTPSSRRRTNTPRRRLNIVSTGDSEQIQHVRHRGYVERPVQTRPIERSLADFEPIYHAVRSYSDDHLGAVHSDGMITFLREAEDYLEPSAVLYPSVFPVREADRVAELWDMQAGSYCFDIYTPITPRVFAAARKAVDAALTGAHRILAGGDVTYVIGRPPGHHAESTVFGGFCYFNNAAIAAAHLTSKGRVAILDIDHHHGNGTQDIFYDRSDVFVASIHGHPRLCYPYFAGHEDERGQGEGRGFNRNFPLYPGVDDAAYLDVLKTALAAIKRFKPETLIVSFGFDIMRGDPTGTFAVTAQGMEQIGAAIGALGPPVLVVQEGGYALRNLRSGAPAFFRGLLSSR